MSKTVFGMVKLLPVLFELYRTLLGGSMCVCVCVCVRVRVRVCVLVSFVL